MDRSNSCRSRFSDLAVHLKGSLVLLLAVISMVSGLAGCSASRALDPDSYVVQRGDTLYDIGRHYGINWHKLARWNQIQPPYRLRVGQRLSLKPFPKIDYAKVGSAENKTTNQRATTPARTGQTHRLPQPASPAVTHNSPGHQQVSSDQTQSAPSSSAAARSGEEHSIDSAASSSEAKEATVKTVGPQVDGWHWPTGGQVLRGYNPSSRHHGIEIGGEKGDPVRATSSGQVVYNGSGLKGYGRLIIIKHNAHYLSAYGFLKRSLVKEGQTVKAGTHIADMGLGPGNKPMLLFEIRHDGDPIDPQKVLPKR